MEYENPWATGDVPAVVDAAIEVPYVLDTLPDGRESLLIGDVESFKDLVHPQGDNPFDYQGTCGLCSCEGVLGQFGVDVSEAEIVEYAKENDLCNNEGDKSMRGGTTVDHQVQILSDYGVPAHAESAGSLEDLAANLEQRRGVIIEANAGVLWDDPFSYDGGDANHAIVPIGVDRDPATGEILGFRVNDTGTGESDRFVPAETMRDAWLEAGGMCVVTDIAHESTAQPIGSQ